MLGTWVFVEHLPYYRKYRADGFNIGYDGSGPRELAYSICKYFNAESYHYEFNAKVITRLNRVDMIIPFSHIKMMFEDFKIRSESAV